MNTLTTETIEQKIEQAYPFGVRKLPLRGPDNMETPHYGIFRDDNFACIGAAVRKNYTPHRNHHLTQLVSAAQDVIGSDGMELKLRWHNAAHVITLMPSDEYRRAVFGTQDNLNFRLNITAGYDGNSVDVRGCVFRDACSNLMMLRKVGEMRFRTRHHLGLDESVGDIASKVGILCRRWNTYVEQIRSFAATEIDWREYCDQMFDRVSIEDEAAEAKERREQRRLDKIKAVERYLKKDLNRFAGGHYDLASTDRMVTGNVNSWLAFNAVQSYVQHRSNRRGLPKDNDREIRELRALKGLEDPRVAKAERIAHDMAFGS